MPLVTAAQLRQTVQTALDDATLQSIIDAEEAALVAVCGPHLGPMVEAIGGVHGRSLFLCRPIASVTSITADGTAVTASGYTVLGRQGRIVGTAPGWGGAATLVVTYTPVDDTVERARVLIELVRLRLEQTAMQSESVAGEYSYTAPDWELTRRRLYTRLLLGEV